MATTIITKFKASGGAPAIGDLAVGELAVDHLNKKIYTKSAAAGIITLAGLDTLPEILANGNTTGGTDLAVSSGDDITFADSSKAIFGAGSDLEILSNGTDGLIRNGNATGEIRMESDDRIIFADRGFNEVFAVFNDDDDVKLYHDSNQKLATTATGIDVTGTVTADELGIGTSSPDTLLHLSGDATSIIRLENTNAGLVLNSVIGSIEFEKQDGSGAGAGVAGSMKLITSNNNGAESSLVFSTCSTARGNNAEAMRIDGLGQVGIGSTAPDKLLVVQGASAEVVISDSSNSPLLRFRESGVTKGTIGTSSGDLIFDSGGDTERMRIDANGNVGIGTSTPSNKLHVYGGNTGTNVDIASFRSATGAVSIKCSDLSEANPTWTLRTFSGEPLAFGQGVDERMRIDSSGNLLVGKTSTTFGTVGVENRADGRITSTRSGNTNLLLNRLASDGDIVQFYKDGASVGSIGTNSGYVRIGTDDVNLLMHSGIDTIIPHSGSANRDDAINLGYSGARFKDLFLSGGVYVGGTGAANKLDDFETGTFTPVMENVTGWSGSSGVDGTYTKIGNTVHVFISMTSNVALTGTPTNRITGLPFSSDLGERCSNVSVSRMFGINLTTTDYIAGVSGSEVVFGYVNGDNNTNNFTHSGSTLRFTLSATYTTAA